MVGIHFNKFTSSLVSDRHKIDTISYYIGELSLFDIIVNFSYNVIE